MGRKKLSGSNNEIMGFWSREEGETIRGVVQNHVKSNPSDFTLIELQSKAMVVSQENDKPHQVGPGSLIGVSHSKGIANVLSRLNTGDVIELVSAGKTKTRSGNEFWNIDVYLIDDEGTSRPKAGKAG